MTDQELKALKDRIDKLQDTISQRHTMDTSDWDEIRNIKEQIDNEETKRFTDKHLNEYKIRLKDFFNMSQGNNVKLTEHLWVVEVDGKKLRKSKGGFTWKSENRAFRGICDYIYYNFYHYCGHLPNNLDIETVVNSLIDEGYIKIKQIL